MRALLIIILAGVFVGSAPTEALAHCDTYDGPVVKAGEKSLETADLDFALIWVKPEAEAELRAAFKQALGVRKLNADARELADRYFLETLVRLHRAGEGEPFTGIEPKGTDLGPAIPLADAAIKAGSARAVTNLINDATAECVQHRFTRVLAKRKFKPHDVSAGREYVEAYVGFMHYVEGVYDAAAATAH
jgi:hypothetical protein